MQQLVPSEPPKPIKPGQMVRVIAQVSREYPWPPPVGRVNRLSESENELSVKSAWVDFVVSDDAAADQVVSIEVPLDWLVESGLVESGNE